jgi:hypothetical protein
MAKVTITIWDKENGSVGIAADTDNEKNEEATDAEKVAGDILASVKAIMDQYGGWPMEPKEEGAQKPVLVPNPDKDNQH